MSRTQIDTSLIGSLSNTFIGLGRNRIHNGDIRLDQVNAGASASAASGVSVSGPDGITLINGVSTAVVQIAVHVDTPPDNFTNYTRITCNTADASIAAGDFIIFDRNLEGNMISDMNFGMSTARTITYSFYVRSTLTGIYSGVFTNSAQNRHYAFEYTINAANTWERKSITFIGDTTGTWVKDNGLGIRIRMALAIGSTFQGTVNTWQGGFVLGTSNQVNFVSSNSSRTIDFSGFQLEIGSLPTAFEFRPFTLELELCQRYYEKSYDLNTAPGTATVNGYTRLVAGKINTNITESSMCFYKVTKRTQPTVTVYRSDNGASGSAIWRGTTAIESARPTSVGVNWGYGFNVNQTSGEDFLCYLQWTADARL